MKIRTSYVSNSSSSSFVVLKDALTGEQIDQIMSYVEWVEFFIQLDNEKYKDNDGYDGDDSTIEVNSNYSSLEDKFSYYKSDPWRLIEEEDYIFGETSMDNFSMFEYFDFIKVPSDYTYWDNGYLDEPLQSQLRFIRDKKQEYRKRKINNINKSQI